MKQPLDIYDEVPREQRAYLANYGWHFNERACKYAVSLMRHKNKTTQALTRIDAWSKDDVDALLKREGVKLENNTLHDYVFVANMAKSVCLGSSLEDEAHVAKHVKDIIDNAFAGDGYIMRFWYATMVAKGEPIDWSELL